MASGDVWKKIRGLSNSLLQIGLGGVQLKNNAGVLEARDSSDSAFVIGRGLDPVANNDWVTLAYFNANNNAATGLTIVRMPLALATKVSAVSIPDNVELFWTRLQISTAYDAAATWNFLRTGDATVIPQATSDNDPITIGSYTVEHDDVNWGSTGAGTLTATLTNSPTVGVGEVFIAYSTPNDLT